MLNAGRKGVPDLEGFRVCAACALLLLRRAGVLQRRFDRVCCACVRVQETMYRAVEIMRALDIRTYKPGVKASPRPSGLCAPSLVVALCNKRDHKLIALSRRNQLLVP